MSHVRKVAAMLIAIVGLAVGCSIVTLLWTRRGDSVLPEPTGAFGVSRATLELRNPAATSQTTAPDAPSNELVVWIWYPTDKNPNAAPMDYLPGPWLDLARRNNPFPISLLTRDLSRVRGHSIHGAISSKQTQYPVVVLRGGLGAKTLDYTTLAEDLSSHGYVVVGFDAPYRTTSIVFADGRVVVRPASNNPETVRGLAAQDLLTARLLAGWVADTRFVLDELARLDLGDSTGLSSRRLDLNNIGVVGHSLGGATAAQVCHDDSRCKAGIDLDGAPRGPVVASGLERPFMFFVSDHADTASAEGKRIVADLRAIYDRLPTGDGYWITLRGSGHFNFSDQALYRNAHVFRRLGAIGPIDERRALTVTTEYVRRFFDVYLRGASSLRLSPSSDFPEAEFAPRRVDVHTSVVLDGASATTT